MRRGQAQLLLHRLDEDRLVLGRQDQDLQQFLQRQVQALDALLVFPQVGDELLDAEDEFGTDKALDYLIREKFLNFLEAAETDAEFRGEIPAFVAAIRTIFERWQLAEELERARRTEPFDPDLYDEEEDPEDIEDHRQEEIRRSAGDLLLVERAREWLLEDNRE
jgi:hypothetical protein